MKLTSTDDAGLRVIRVEEDRIDAAAAIQFKDRFISIVKGHDGPVVLNLLDVTFIDSSGLGAVVAVRKYLQDGQALHLAGLQPAVAKVMALTRMDRVFPIHQTADAACETLRSGHAA